MKSLGLDDVEEFPFLDPPQSRSISEDHRVLEELAALDERRELTELGERLARFPVDPRIARMILAGAKQGCLRDILVIAAVAKIEPEWLEQAGKHLLKRSYSDPHWTESSARTSMFPPDLLAAIELQRLTHFPRYLRAAQTRLGRAVTDPRRDAEKFALLRRTGRPSWPSAQARASEVGPVPALGVRNCASPSLRPS